MKVLAALVLLALIAGAYLYREQTVPPGCSDQSTTDLVKKILIEKDFYPSGIRIGDIRTEQGWLFAHRFECVAKIKYDSSNPSTFGVENPDIHYSSELTDDTHMQYVTVEARPFARSEQHPAAIEGTPLAADHGSTTALSCLTVQNVDSSLLERDELYMRLSWQADVANSCATPFDVRVVFKIFDKNAFELDWAMEYISVPANGIGKARGILFGETGTISRLAKQSATLAIP
jgi:hypothetical protein